MNEAERVRQSFIAKGQGHIFSHWQQLEPEAQKRLINQASTIDLERLKEWQEALIQISDSTSGINAKDIEPAPYLRHPSNGGDNTSWERSEAKGIEALKAGRVAAFTRSRWSRHTTRPWQC